MQPYLSLVLFFGFGLLSGYCCPTGDDSNFGVEAVPDLPFDASLEELLAVRGKLINQMTEINSDIDQSAKRNDLKKINTSLGKFELAVWPKLVDLSSRIFSKKRFNDTELSEETDLQKELKKKAASLRFKAGTRKCENPDEAFHEKTNKCEKLGNRFTTREENPCPENQLFYEIANNEGVCDCAHNDFKLDWDQLVYAADGQCYEQNTKGSCKSGEWLRFVNGEVKCEAVPNGCPDDGKHVFGKPVDAAAGCYELGKQGPCSSFNFVFRTSSGDIKCRPEIAVDPAWAFGPLPPLNDSKGPCASTSFRAQNNKCI